MGMGFVVVVVCWGAAPDSVTAGVAVVSGLA